MTTDQAYTILRVEPGATPKDVQKAYRARAMECHPDRASSEEQAAYLTKKFMEVRDAYEYLRKEGFPVPETEEVLEDLDPPVSWTAWRSFAPKEPPEDPGFLAKLGISPEVDLQAVVLWGIVIPGAAVCLFLFLKWLRDYLLPV